MGDADVRDEAESVAEERGWKDGYDDGYGEGFARGVAAERARLLARVRELRDCFLDYRDGTTNRSGSKREAAEVEVIYRTLSVAAAEADKLLAQEEATASGPSAPPAKE